jgi:hypothetical protein
MAWSVIQQPDGKFTVWCTIGDQFLLMDATAEDVEQEYVERAIEDAKRCAAHVVARARGEAMPRPAYSLDVCVELAEANYPGQDLLPHIKKMLQEGAGDND